MHQHKQDLDEGRARLRQKRLALILTGDDRTADMLVERSSLAGAQSSGAEVSSSAFEYFQLKKLYELWISEPKDARSSAPIFEAGRANDAIQKGLDPSIAKIMGELPTLHRAVLLLVYGEKFSYAATAQLLGISIEELMGALASAQQQFLKSDNAIRDTRNGSLNEPYGEAAHDTA